MSWLLCTTALHVVFSVVIDSVDVNIFDLTVILILIVTLDQILTLN